MVRMKADRRIDRIIRLLTDLKFIIVVAVLLRVGAALYLGNSVISLPGTADQVSYHNLALRVWQGNGFSFAQAWWPMTDAGDPTAHWSFLYTFYLVVIYAIFGPVPLVARLIQAVLVGIVQPVLAYRLAFEVLGAVRGIPEAQVKRAALFTAGVTAVYTYFIYYAGTLMTEPFFMTILLAVLLGAILVAKRITTSGFWKAAILLGLAIGAAVLLRQLVLLFLPFLFLWLIWATYRQGAWRRGLIVVAISIGILVAAILPFTIYNYMRFDRFVLLNTNAGYVMFWANHPIHGTSFVPAAEMGDTYQKLVPAELRDLDEAALDQALLRLGVQFIFDDPGRYLLLCLSRIPAYFRFWPEPASGMLSNLARVSSFGLFLPFMFYGLLRPLFILRETKKQSSFDFLASPLCLIYLFILVYTLIHVLTWTLVRYRLPVDAVLVIFAGLAMGDLFRALEQWSGQRSLNEPRDPSNHPVRVER